MQNKEPKMEHGFMLVSYYDEHGNHFTKKVPTVVQRGGKVRPVTPEMRQAIEDRREAYLAELRARVGPRKSSKAKPSPRKRAA